MSIRTVLIAMDGTEFDCDIVQVVRTYIDPDEVRLVLLRSLAAEPDLSYGTSGHDRADSAEADVLPAHPPSPAQRNESALLLCELRERLISDVDSLRNAGYTVTGEVRFGETVQQVADYVAEKHVSLVAMTTQGDRGGMPIPGSVADRIVRGLSVPVLLMRTNGG